MQVIPHNGDDDGFIDIKMNQKSRGVGVAVRWDIGGFGFACAIKKRKLQKPTLLRVLE